MLLEHQELRKKLAHFALESHSSFVRHDLVIAELTNRITALDDEIRISNHQAVRHFADQDRSVEELWTFIGDDLMDELVVIEERQLA